MSQVIVVGGGLSGMSAAHTVVQNGGKVVVIDKMPFCGGNSTKATSGINAAGTSTQRKLGIPDSAEVFEQDTTVSATPEGARPNLIKALTHQSGPAVEWLMESFGLDLSVIARLAAHSHPRTHRGTERFPGMMITYGLMEKLDEIAAAGDAARVINKATVTDLIIENGEVKGVKFTKDGQTYEERGPVIIATGGFGADFSSDSLLNSVSEEWSTLGAWQSTSRAGKQIKPERGEKVWAPNLMTLPTTNGNHCTGDGIKLAVGAGADTYDLHCVQVHPTGLVDPVERDAKVKFLAAEALRGSGGIILDAEGKRFCDELGKRDYVSGRMWFHGKAPYRLILNGKSEEKIAWHCEHYQARGLMKQMTGAELAKEIGCSESDLRATFDQYNRAAENPKGPDNEWDKKFFESMPYVVNDKFMVAEITPVVHYCMGGVAGNEFAEVLDKNAKAIRGLYAAGEALGGVHGVNRLGGSSLLDCVVYGRIAGQSASKQLLGDLIAGGGATGSTLNNGIQATVNVTPGSNKVSLEFSFGGASGSNQVGSSPAHNSANAAVGKEIDPNAAFYGQGFTGDAGAGKKEATLKEYTLADVQSHNTEKDCWVILHGEVYDVTDFLQDHPGGARAIVMYAGKDATEPFDMLHSMDLLEKVAVDYKIGKLISAKL